VGGIDPRLHITVHEIVAGQLWNDDPPEVWQAARRLHATGMSRHDVLHTIGETLVEHLGGALSGRGPTDRARYIVALDELGRAEEATVVPLRRKR
jgi:hypothetical protein